MSDPRQQLDALDAAQSAAYDEVIRLCKGGRWTMRVPVDEKRDSDAVIVAGLEGVPRLTSALRAVLNLADKWDDVAVQHDMRGDAELATRYSAVARQVRRACQRHLGQLADYCGPCRSEQIGAA